MRVQSCGIVLSGAYGKIFFECLRSILKEHEKLFENLELLRNVGYKAETHYVITKDRSVFDVHRMHAPGKPVVYVVPGVFMSTRDLIINCHGRALVGISIQQ